MKVMSRERIAQLTKSLQVLEVIFCAIRVGVIRPGHSCFDVCGALALHDWNMPRPNFIERETLL